MHIIMVLHRNASSIHLKVDSEEVLRWTLSRFKVISSYSMPSSRASLLLWQRHPTPRQTLFSSNILWSFWYGCSHYSHLEAHLCSPWLTCSMSRRDWLKKVVIVCWWACVAVLLSNNFCHCKKSPKHCWSTYSITLSSGPKPCLKRQWYLPLIS